MRPGELNELYEELCAKNKTPETLEEMASIPHYKKLEKMSEKRFIKSHLGFALLHPQLLDVGCKVRLNNCNNLLSKIT